MTKPWLTIQNFWGYVLFAVVLAVLVAVMGCAPWVSA